MPKRRKTADAKDAEESTPRKSRRTAKADVEVERIASPLAPAETPSKRKSILRGTPTKHNGFSQPEATPKSLRKVLFSTPNKPVEEGEDEEETPTAVRNDRSARRKSARALQKQVDDASEDEEAAQGTHLAKEILGDDGSDEEGEDDVELAEPASTTSTPSQRGRPKGRRRERTPSPPLDLSPHELYFFQNRTGANKTSSNTLPSHLLLNHEDYFTQTNTYQNPHEADIRRLQDLHKRAFNQWMFELEEGFNICLYGYGSKRELVMEFAEYIYTQASKNPPKVVVVNGYTPGLTIRDILTTLSSIILHKATKLPAQPTAILDLLLTTLSQTPPSVPIHLIIHSLDHANLRSKPNTTQNLLARLASHPSIALTATVDTPTFPLLWDTTLLRQFRFLHHDATTFRAYTAELDVVEEVNALLGRSGRRLGGKDGVGYVLKSLPENARALFRVLVGEQLALADAEPHSLPAAAEDDDSLLGAEDEEEAAAATPSHRVRGRGRPPKKKAPKPAPKPPRPTVATVEGVEYRTLYHKAVEEFICSSELNFRTLLKEFHDHQMVESRRDGLGTERLVVPFGREELEGMLEELG